MVRLQVEHQRLLAVVVAWLIYLSMHSGGEVRACRQLCKCAIVSVQYSPLRCSHLDIHMHSNHDSSTSDVFSPHAIPRFSIELRSLSCALTSSDDKAGIRRLVTRQAPRLTLYIYVPDTFHLETTLTSHLRLPPTNILRHLIITIAAGTPSSCSRNVSHPPAALITHHPLA